MQDDLQASLQVLSQARDPGVAWVDVADALLALEATSRRASDGRTWTSVAAQSSQIAEAQLRRFARTCRILREAETERPGLVDRLRRFPFSQAEVLGKIWQLDRHKALDLIDRATNPNTFTYLELLKKYQDFRSEGRRQISTIAAGKQAAQQFINASRNILQRTQHLTSGPLFPEGRRTLLRLVTRFEYAKVDFVIHDTSVEGAPLVEAVDCYFISDRTQYDLLQRKIAQVAFESTFFTRFWCLIPPHDFAGELHAAFDQLELDNVGLLLVNTAQQSILPRRDPNRGAKLVPDRRHLFLSSQAYKRLRPP